jgi:hypothetical protein
MRILAPRHYTAASGRIYEGHLVNQSDFMV